MGKLLEDKHSECFVTPNDSMALVLSMMPFAPYALLGFVKQMLREAGIGKFYATFSNCSVPATIKFGEEVKSRSDHRFLLF
ncbi:hypothetical protein BDV32DRAFT_130413 [Aspergillus pseudonomiae]|nr:hypothetical protein BDV32DRAFT_130413 [Aspergillus pseudonomiae]